MLAFALGCTMAFCSAAFGGSNWADRQLIAFIDAGSLCYLGGFTQIVPAQ